MNAVQCKMARAAVGIGVRELAAVAKVSPDTVARLERGEPLRERTVDAIRAALEAAGVEFTNGDHPGVRVRKPAPKRLNERERAESAKKYAREWTEYCKATKSMAFASANDDLILIQFRRVDSLDIFNLFHVRVLEEGFELDGKIVDGDEMSKIVHEALDSKPRFLGGGR